jgi:hypothetical protein
MITFASLEKAATKSNNAAAIAVLSDAAINADDTVREGSTEAWDAIALASIAYTSSFTEDRKVQAWFQRRGYEW